MQIIDDKEKGNGELGRTIIWVCSCAVPRVLLIVTSAHVPRVGLDGSASKPWRRNAVERSPACIESIVPCRQMCLGGRLGVPGGM